LGTRQKTLIEYTEQEGYSMKPATGLNKVETSLKSNVTNVDNAMSALANPYTLVHGFLLEEN